MSDETRYPCCEHCDRDYDRCALNDDHPYGCLFSDRCPGSVPVGPTKEGKQ